MDRRRRRQKEERGRELEEALNIAENALGDSNVLPEDDLDDTIEDVDWDSVPACIDPACKEANLHKEGRAYRKRQQLASIAYHVRRLLQPGDRCVEFGAGSGHLSLLLAWLFPGSFFVMCERKEYSVNAALARIAEVRLPINL